MVNRMLLFNIWVLLLPEVASSGILTSETSHHCTNPFIVLTGARSGSTWFGELLNAHPQVDYQGEMMVSRARYPTTREALQLLHELQSSCKYKYRAAGIKWFPGQGGVDFGQDVELANWVRAHDFRIILLLRESSHRYFSLQRALKTGVWDCSDSDCVRRERNTSLRIDLEHMRWTLAQYDADMEAQRRWALRAAPSERFMFLKYEDLISAPEAAWLPSIWSFLGVRPFNASSSNLPSVQMPGKYLRLANPHKLSDEEHLSAGIENWEEVKSALTRGVPPRTNESVASSKGALLVDVHALVMSDKRERLAALVSSTQRSMAKSTVMHCNHAANRTSCLPCVLAARSCLR